MRLKSILCPIDFSEFSSAAYQHASPLAEYYQARLICLRIVELWKYPFADYAAHAADYAKFAKALNEGGEVQLQKFVKQYSGERTERELVVRQGNASDCTLAFAQKESIEVIVTGNMAGGDLIGSEHWSSSEALTKRSYVMQKQHTPASSL